MIIPKIIHQIWIGPNKIPKIWMDTITNFCNKYNYQYILWDDNTVNNFTLTNKKYYDIEKTFNGKSDILRYEILYNYGGIYIDGEKLTELNKGAWYSLVGFVPQNVILFDGSIEQNIIPC